MTNVVGVLIVVLIVTQVNVSSAAKRMRANLPEVSVEMMEALQAKEEESERRLAALLQPQEVSPEELKRARDELRNLRARRDEGRMISKEVARLEIERETLEKEVEALRQQFEAEGGELAEIRSTLEANEAEMADRKPKLVRLPNPRSPEEGAEEVRMIVRGGRLLHFDREGILDRLAAKITARKDLLSSDPKMKTRYDRDKLTEFLATLKESDPDFSFEFVVHKNGHVHVQCTPRDGSGESLEDLAGPGARGRRVMAQAFGDRNYIRYFVTSDSFEHYVAVRRMAEKIQIPVGWIFADETARQTLSLWERRILATPDPDWEPPQPKPGPKPKPKPQKKVQEDILD